MTTSTSANPPRPALTVGSLPDDCEPFCSCGGAIEPDPRRDTVFSVDTWGPDGRGAWRFTLWRQLAPEMWSPRRLQICAFIGLNPSTATETRDDPTIRRCRDFATTWGFGWMLMLNLFAFRATDPRAMKKAQEPIGAGNDQQILHWSLRAGAVIAAWGTHGSHRGRAREVESLLAEARIPLRAFKLNDDGSPVHPLYQPKRDDLPPLLDNLRTGEK